MADILKTIFFNKRVVISSLMLVLIFSLIPLYFVQAAWWDIFPDILGGIITLPMKFAALFVAVPVALIATLVAILYSIFIFIFGWLQTIALSVPVIPAKVGVVMAGWTITQNLANMFLILILVFIGLATILRLKEYEAKKLLPTLILVALLINFSPVLVGFVVDISNIVSNAFLNLGTFEMVGDVWEMILNYWIQVVAILVTIGPILEIIGTIVATVVLGVVLIAFFGYAAWIYFLVAGLLIVRIIYLWILMILAPIAFLSKTLPAKGAPKLLFPGILHWDEWWQELVKWSIIAIPVGFFLFLSFELLKYTADVQSFFGVATLEGTVGGIELESPAEADWGLEAFFGSFANMLGIILVPLLSVIILHIGYNLSRKNMPAAAQGIISGIEKGMKMIAGTALVVATGGAAAGLAVKGLGGLTKMAGGAAKVAQRMDIGASKLPFGKVWAQPFTKLTAWGTRGGELATRGIEKAVTPALLEYQAKTRKVPDKDIEKIDKMAPADAEAYINAKTKMLPGPLRKQQRGQYMSRMADKEMLEFTSSGFRTEAGEWANEIREKENPYYQKEAITIAKALPETVREEALVHSKLVGMPDKTPEDKAARKKKEDEIREEIRETQDIIQKRIGRENFIIEAALQLKYVTKDDVESDRAAALTEIQRRAALKPGELERAQRNIAASATFTKELKPEDMKKMIDPDTFATRAGITLGNPRNLQRIQDNFGIKKLKAVIEKSGGLNDATDSPEKLDEFNKINPQMVNAILSSPAYRELDIEARKHMLDPNDQPTTNFDTFKRRGRIQDITRGNPTLQQASGLLKNMATLRRNLARAREDAEIRDIRQQLTDLQDRAEITKGKLTPENQKLWDEIENLMGGVPPTPPGGRRRRRRR